MPDAIVERGGHTKAKQIAEVICANGPLAVEGPRAFAEKRAPRLRRR